jgi:hypothetical protein
MKIKYIVISLLCIIPIGVLILLFGFWWSMGPTKIESKHSLTLQEATNSPIPLPESAKNIQFAQFSDWQIFDCFVRFEAPVEVCKAHAKSIMKKYQDTFHRKSDLDSNFRTVSSVPHPASSHFKDLSWFDTENLSNALVIGGDNDLQPHIWIDQKRGVFYYHSWQ